MFFRALARSESRGSIERLGEIRLEKTCFTIKNIKHKVLRFTSNSSQVTCVPRIPSATVRMFIVPWGILKEFRLICFFIELLKNIQIVNYYCLVFESLKLSKHPKLFDVDSNIASLKQDKRCVKKRGHVNGKVGSSKVFCLRKMISPVPINATTEG